MRQTSFITFIHTAAVATCEASELPVLVRQARREMDKARALLPSRAAMSSDDLVEASTQQEARAWHLACLAGMLSGVATALPASFAGSRCLTAAWQRGRELVTAPAANG